MNTEEEIRELAEQNVLAVRGSYDAPGFEACVLAEIENIKIGILPAALEVMKKMGAALDALYQDYIDYDPNDTKRELFCEPAYAAIAAYEAFRKEWGCDG
jgi:hypothetical protein